MKPRVRFAPSPTGPLHIGGVRTALYNYLFARQHGGQFLLRIEDTDQTRFVPGAEDYIVEALAWLGIEIDEGPGPGGPHAPYRQSERKPMYRQYAEQLIASGHAYYAFDTPEELQTMRDRLEAGGMKAPGYNYLTREHMQNSLALPTDEVARRLEIGVEYVIRIKFPRKEDIRFEDSVRGWVTVNTAQLDDKVLLKSDGMPTYHLANVVDDHLMGITHVIRGEEWLPSTPLHVYLYRSFGWEAPTFAHLPLLLKPTGKGKLSKRDGDALGIPVFPLEWTDPESGAVSAGFREAGYLPEALTNFLALLGWHPSGDEELFDLPGLVNAFSLERVGKAGVKFDVPKLRHFNQHYLRQRANADFRPLLEAYLVAHNLENPGEARLLEVVEMLKERVEILPDFAALAEPFFIAPTTYNTEDVARKWSAELAPVVGQVADAWEKLTSWNAESIKQAVFDTATAAGQKMGKLMPMLRLAATGSLTGPDLLAFLTWLGQTEAVQRTRAAVKVLS